MEETRGHGVVNFEEVEREIAKIEGIIVGLSDIVENLKMMPKVVTNLEDSIAE
jgi:hypothetical protein